MDNKEYSIIASAEAFDTLSSKLYTNPVAAVIRELSSNAYDSHIAKGNLNKPFDLHVPTDNETYFSIRDYGEGMSNDFIMSVFTTYFASTKGNKDDQIGGFGLGSKTPYALVDEYYVTSYYEGKETKFKMFKRNGCPVVEKQSEVETDEPSGLKIEFDLSSEWGYYSETKWNTEATKFFSGFMCQPNWNLKLGEKDLKRLALSKCYYNKDNAMLNWESNNILWRNKITANVAGVIYEVKNSIIDVPYPFDSINIMAEKNDVTVTPSREELHYDDKTIKFITDNVGRIIKEKVKEIFDNIDNCSYDFYKLRKLSGVRSDDEISYNNQKIEDKASEFLNDIFDSNCYRLFKSTVKRNNIKTTHSRSCWNSVDNVFVGLLNTEGCKTAQLNTIKATLNEGLNNKEEEQEKVSSKAFSDRVRNFFKASGKSQSDHDLVILTVKEGKEEIAKKILVGNNTSYDIFKYADYANNTSSKKSSTKRGFITQGSIIYNNYTGESGYRRSEIDPDVRQDELPLVTCVEKTDSFEHFFPLLKIVKPTVNIVLRVCKEESSITNVCRQNKCEDAIEWAKRIIIENKDLLKEHIKTSRLSSALNKVFGTKVFYDYEEYNEAKPALFALKLSNNASKLLNTVDYVQENKNLIAYSSLVKEIFKDEADIKDGEINFENYPMLKYMDYTRSFGVKNFCTDCLEYITSIDNR